MDVQNYTGPNAELVNEVIELATGGSLFGGCVSPGGDLDVELLSDLAAVSPGTQNRP